MPSTRMRQPFHEGEIALQERTGERDAGRRNGVGISTRINPGALTFLARQRLVAVSAAGDAGRLWTTVWYGQPGFVQSADGQRVTFDRRLFDASADDPILSRDGLMAGADLGVLAIDLESRRRLRINGTVASISSEAIEMAVRESVANCPRYIERRQAHDVPASPTTPSARGATLDEARQALIARADTAFVGSVHPARGLDTSHRGGMLGFIQVLNSATLRIPDYPGNSMFLTLGNFTVDPRASLAVVDFEGGRVLALSGSAHLSFGAEDPKQPTGGTGRYWTFTIEHWIEFAPPASVRWEWLDSSPYSPEPSGTR